MSNEVNRRRSLRPSFYDCCFSERESKRIASPFWFCHCEKTGFGLFMAFALSGGMITDRATAASPDVRTNSIGMRLARVPAGEFMMGSTHEEADLLLKQMKEKRVHAWYQASPPGEVPRHRVKVTKPFYLGAFEVTLGQFRQFVEATGYRTDAETDGKGGDGKVNGKWTTRPAFNWKNMGYERSEDMPVVNVTWNDAVAFCAWLGKKENARYRLPTEAEWEYACRAGATGPYFWGADAERNQFVWHGVNSAGGPHRVGELKPNAWGFYDICGNVYEYCSDWFSTNCYTVAPVEDPKGPMSGEERVVRGGSWGTDPMHCRSSFRGGAGPTHRNMRDGFRVVREAESP